MQIKICGLTRRDDADLAERLGADFLGAIMAGGPRNLTADQAAQVLGPRRHTVKRAAVFGAQMMDEIARIAGRISLDVVQLHGDPTPEAVRQLRERVACAVWPVLRVEGTSIPHAAVELAEAAGALLLDAKVVGHLGGTGSTLDWRGLHAEVSALRAAVPGVQIILAGGLKSTNVVTARGLLLPDVVDVSSGVETAPGIKDAAQMAAFINVVRARAHNAKHVTGHQ
jgi:phosphoribosylanthranilate isomerase